MKIGLIRCREWSKSYISNVIDKLVDLSTVNKRGKEYKMTKIFENDLIKVSTKGKNSASIAIATIENKTDGQICVHYDEPGYNDNYDPILIAPNNCAALLEGRVGRDWLKAIENNQIYVETNDEER